MGLYLLLTIAPFALIAPLIGPLLDRLQHGRRAAMAATFAARAVLTILDRQQLQWDPAGHQLVYDPWVLYPCALGLLVFSKVVRCAEVRGHTARRAAQHRPWSE